MATKNLFSTLSEKDRKKLKKSAVPSFIQPMLATLTHKYFSSKEWVYEHKFDGIRCLAFKKKGIVTLMSRNEHHINTQFPEIAKALEAQAADNFVIDGEIVALNKQGISDFQMLQSRINVADVNIIASREIKTPTYYRIFDIMHLDRYDVRELPLLSRKKLLKKLLQYTKKLTYTTHKSPDGLKYYKEACRLHWEGLIAKKSDSTYVSIRSPYWLKFKCTEGQELIICGYTEPKGSRTDFGALLVGYYKNKKLIYAGKVGTGYDQQTLTMLGKKLRRLEIKKCPFESYKESIRGVHWVSPKLVADFVFAEWTKGGQLRAGRYKGLRTDKSAKAVVRE